MNFSWTFLIQYCTNIKFGYTCNNNGNWKKRIDSAKIESWWPDFICCELLILQGESIGTTEATEAFFAMTKLFQAKDVSNFVIIVHRYIFLNILILFIFTTFC